MKALQKTLLTLALTVFFFRSAKSIGQSGAA